MKFFFDEDLKPLKKFNTILTPLQVQNILNRCILAAGKDEKLIEDIKTLKEYLK